MFPDLQRFKYLALDTETDGLSPAHGARMYSFTLSLPDAERTDLHYDLRLEPQAGRWLVDQMRQYRGVVVCHNASFDYRHCAAADIALPLDSMRCTAVRQTIINEHEYSYQLGNLAKKYCRAQKVDQPLYDALAAQFGGRATRSGQILNMQYVTPAMDCWHIVVAYGKADTRSTLELFEWQQIEITKQGLERIDSLENRLMPHIIRAEQNGLRVNTEKAQLAVITASTAINHQQAELDALAGFRVNVNAPEDVQRIFAPVWRDGAWWSRTDEPIASTPGGQPSMAKEVLMSLGHPAAQQVLELRSMIKTRDTFLMGHVIGSEVGGRVYPSINQGKTEGGQGTGTGRLSYSDPAMQQIPSRNKVVAAIVKDIFLPEEGHVWVDSDKASFEVRTFAHHCNNAELIQAYIDNPELDFHQKVSELTGLPRNQKPEGGPYAKQLNLSMIYAQGEGTTAEQLDLDWEWDSFIPDNGTDEEKRIYYKKPGPEAKGVIENYHLMVPGVRELTKGCKKRAEQRGYLFTPHGRRLRFPNKRFAYKGIALLCQATAADMNKSNWILINDELDRQGNGAKMLLNTHDSYGVSVSEEHAERTMRRVKTVVESERDLYLRVPLVLEVNKPGATWWASVSAGRWL